MVQTHDELLTVKEAAAILKVTPHTVYRWVSEGRLPAVRHSRVVRLRRSDLERQRVRAKMGSVADEPGGELWRMIREARERDRAAAAREFNETKWRTS